MPKTKPVGRSAKIYRIKVWLLSHLGIWRDIEVSGDSTLKGLHYAIQRAMGWDDGHPHQFTIKRVRYTEPDEGLDEYFESGDLQNEYVVQLADVVRRKGAKFEYLYDYGDMWRHELLVESIHPAEPGVEYPRCVAGEWACPPEDCGGPGGYQRMLGVLANPQHADYGFMQDMWGANPPDPAKFDLDEANERLRR